MMNKLPAIKPLTRIKKYLLGIFVVVSVVIATLSALMSTETGSHWVVRQLAKSFHFSLGALHGNLLTGLDVTKVEYRRNDFALRAEKLSFRWEPSGLFYTSLNVQSLSGEKIYIKLPPSKEEPELDPYPWPSLAQPIRIKLENVDLREIHIQQGDKHFPLVAVKGNIGLGTLHLRARDFSVVTDLGHVKVNGSMGLRYPYDLNTHINWLFKDASLPGGSVAGNVALGGDIKTLKVDQTFSQPLKMSLVGNISPAIHEKTKTPHARISLSWAEQPLPADVLEYVKPVLGKFENSDVQKKVSEKVTTNGQILYEGWINQSSLSTKIRVDSEDRLANVDGLVRINYSDQENVLEAQLDNVQLRLRSKSEGTKNIRDIEFNNTLALKGNIRGLNAWQWNLHLATDHFNLNSVDEQWPSDLTGSVSLQGRYDPAQKAMASRGVSLQLNDIYTQGNLRGLAVSARGQIDYREGNWSSSDANLAIGANQFKFKGSLGEQLNLTWEVDAPLLGQIDPSVKGSIASKGQITGTKANPRINIQGKINDFSWRNYAANDLSLSLKPSVTSQNYDLSFDAAHLQVAGNYVAKVTMKGQGVVSQHKLDLHLESPDLGNTDLKLSGAWNKDEWRTQLHSFNYSFKKMPPWSLASSTPIVVNTQTAKQFVDLGKLCLTTKSAAEVPSACVLAKWAQASGLKVDGNLSAVPASQFHAWIKSGAVLSGVLDGDFSLVVPPTKPLTMDAKLRTRDVELLYQFQGGKVETYPLKKGSLDASIRNNVLNTNLQLDWAPYGLVTANSKYSLNDKKIQGSLSAALLDLAPLEGLLPFLNDVQGSASANLRVNGAIDQLEVVGDLGVKNASANIPKLGLTLRDASLQINAESSGKVRVEGQLTSGDGTLMLRGNVDDFGSPQWSWQSNIYGANIRFIEQPQLIATLSPNLKLSANANAINLSGSTEIPWARAALKTLPASATRVSSDVVVIENEQQLAGISTKKTIPVFTNVILYFGDDVRFKGFGLDTQLLGKVNVLKEEKRQTFVTGFVAVGKGNYKAYGQNLAVERGRLIFQGPYDNPGLDIRATRALDDGFAGLEIGGTLQRPKSSVFAIPATTDSQAMAMLLTGKKLSDSSQADAYSLIGAIGSLGMDNGEGMTSEIANFFHIDEIAVRADKGLDQSALWMGKYVTPKLFIRYIVGLFDQTFSLGVRYQLSEKLRLEAESGKNQSLDVIYKIER